MDGQNHLLAVGTLPCLFTIIQNSTSKPTTLFLFWICGWICHINHLGCCYLYKDTSENIQTCCCWNLGLNYNYSQFNIFISFACSGWMEKDHSLEGHYGVPPHWHEYIPPEQRKAVPVVVRGTSLKEPSCPHSWCNTQHSIQWSGPGEEGYWIDAKRTLHPFVPKLMGNEDEEL